MLGSHDSLTGYPLRNWWIYPFKFFAKTQKKTLLQQLEAGVMYFDLRFRRVAGRIYGAHGIAIYNITIEEVFEVLNASKVPLIIRCVVEDGLFKDDLTVKELFDEVSRLKEDHITLYRIGLKSDWGGHAILNDLPVTGKVDYRLWEIPAKLREIEDVSKKHFDTLTIYEVFTYEGIIPRVAAWFINKKINHRDNVIVFMDFV